MLHWPSYLQKYTFLALSYWKKHVYTNIYNTVACLGWVDQPRFFHICPKILGFGRRPWNIIWDLRGLTFAKTNLALTDVLQRGSNEKKGSILRVVNPTWSNSHSEFAEMRPTKKTWTHQRYRHTKANIHLAILGVAWSFGDVYTCKVTSVLNTCNTSCVKNQSEYLAVLLALAKQKATHVCPKTCCYILIMNYATPRFENTSSDMKAVGIKSSVPKDRILGVPML